MNCPVCRSSETTRQSMVGYDSLLQTSAREFFYRGCAGCSSLFIDPLPQPSELEHFYPPHYWWKPSSAPLTKLESIYRRLALRDHVSFIERAAQSDLRQGRTPRLLDVGCGGGTLLGLLRRRGFDVVGFDTSRTAASLARRESGVTVVTGLALQEGKFEDAAFDIISLFHVMEHLCEPRIILGEVRRILRKTGRVVVQVPNIESWQSRLFGARWYGLDVPRHVINYSSKSIRHLLLDSGFRIRRIRHFNLRDNAPALASSLFPSLDPLRRSVRQREPVVVAWLKHAAYLSVVALTCPFAVAEAVGGCGATVMIEAEKI